MLVKFTKTIGGSLYIMTAEQNGKPGDGIKRLEDMALPPRESGQKPTMACTVVWVENGEERSAAVTGTADENFERLANEERQRAAEYEAVKAQQALTKMPMPQMIDPRVERGRPRR